jgi:hypothetical protein
MLGKSINFYLIPKYALIVNVIEEKQMLGHKKLKKYYKTLYCTCIPMYVISDRRDLLGIRVARLVYFQTKNQNFGKFWRALDCKMLI